MKLSGIATGDCSGLGKRRKYPLLLLVWRQNLPIFAVHYTYTWAPFRRPACTSTKT